MKYFVTGASGWIGSHVTAELIAHGHQVVGLARSDDSAAKVQEAGAEVFRGSIDEPDGAARTRRGVGRRHPSRLQSRLLGARRPPSRPTGPSWRVLLDALVGSDRPFVFASGRARQGRARRRRHRGHRDRPGDGGLAAHPQRRLRARLADRGVRPVAVRLRADRARRGRPRLHGRLRDHGPPVGAAGYVGDGSNTWPAVNIADAAAWSRSRVEKAPAGSVLHAVGEQGVRHLDIAEAIGRGTGLPVRAFAEGEVARRRRSSRGSSASSG